ncbi:ATP-binding cassette domain-containing protein [candidate division KSB1 bacterium]|nr:ATP-binding cassette domain-containing protein [candidate division KSB1 bacterium]
MSTESLTNIIQVEDLTTGYNGRTVLQNVSMVARAHEITVILGASGCGKTTLLKNMIRLYQPWSGSIRLFGKEITDMDEPEFNHLLQNIGVLFQNGALLNSIPVSENISIPLLQHTKLPRVLIQRLVRIKLHLVGLENAGHLLPSELSGGMRKRAALARAIAMDPPLLFGDEPSAGLDPVTSAALDDLLLKLRNDLGMTILLVSHEVPSILRIADSIIFLESGRVLFCGPLKQALTAGIEEVDDFFSKGSEGRRAG